MVESAIELVTENFDRAAFTITYADELAANPHLAAVLAQLDQRAAEIGAAFAADPLCQKLTVYLQHYARGWDIKRSHEAWIAANS